MVAIYSNSRQRIEESGKCNYGLVLAAFILGFFAAVAFSSFSQNGLKLEAGVGECRFQRSPDGTWWQSSHVNWASYKDRCGEIGLAKNFVGSKWGWSVRYVYFGRAHLRAQAQTFRGDDANNIDPNADLLRADCKPAFSEDNCLYRWDGDGGARGFVFSVTRELGYLGPVLVRGEAGLLLYKLKWNAQVHNVDCEDGSCPWRLTVEQKSPRYYPAPALGVHLSYRSFFVALRYYRVGMHQPVTAGVRDWFATTLLGVQIPL